MEHDTSFKVFLTLDSLKSATEKELIIITSFPKHFAIESVKKGWNYFFNREYGLRKKYRLPPCEKMVKINIRSFSESLASKKAELFVGLLGRKAEEPDVIEKIGPFRDFPYKLRGQYYYSIIVKSKSKKLLVSTIGKALHGFSPGNMGPEPAGQDGQPQGPGSDPGRHVLVRA